jgi:hypothetical protein
MRAALSTVSVRAFPLAACGLMRLCPVRCYRRLAAMRCRLRWKPQSKCSETDKICARPSNWNWSRLVTKARLASRRYESVDPEQRLVAAELEARWNTALRKTRELESKLREFDDESHSAPAPNKEVLMSLAQDLPAIWNSPSTDQRLKQRIVRILIREIVADVDEKSREVVLVIHWAGGRHSELRVKKSETGRSRRCTDPETIEVLRQMAGAFTDQQIAAALNRLGLRTGVGNSWNVMRVRSARSYYQLPAFAQSYPPREVTLQEAARRLSVSQSIVRRMIEEKILPARQVVLCAPWQIPMEALDSEAIRQEAANIQNRVRVPPSQSIEGQQSIFSEG